MYCIDIVLFFSFPHLWCNHKRELHIFDGNSCASCWNQVYLHHLSSILNCVKNQARFDGKFYILQLAQLLSNSLSNYPFFIFLCPKIESIQYPGKNRVPELSKQYPGNFGQKISMFFENIAKSKNLCFLLHKNIFILVFFTTQNSIVQGVWIFSQMLEKFDKNLIKFF